MPSSFVRLLAIIAFAVLVASGCAQPPEVGAGLPEATVVRVIDGDTVVVDLGGTEESIRLLGIDTPEVAHGAEPSECFGDEAADRTEALLPAGTSVRLLRDIEARDVYGRLLGYVVAENTMVNDVLVAEGYARTLSIAPNTSMQALFVESESAARQDQRGLWAACQ